VRAFGGISSPWHFIDADRLALHNTNRGLAFFPKDSGWNGGPASLKAQILADYLPGATAEDAWYHESDRVNERYDVCLCLANEYSVRQLVACRNFPVVLQATTGANWLSQMHRHILGVDDCTECRNGENKTPVFECSVVPVRVHEKESDAALPFLSAASGLMLATALQKLQAGQLVSMPRNDWRWDFGSPHKLASSGMRQCKQACANRYDVRLRRSVNRDSLWIDLIQ
ncbi:MAG TPA: hypothetical protein VFM32_06230, partial [Spongiibacteraceae bacterium]|nr:hypothetical protein [Spongiibacteraceae bacterium]